jgi:hypothetical protein
MTKRTLIEHNGLEFELPSQHKLTVNEVEGTDEIQAEDVSRAVEFRGGGPSVTIRQ